MNKPHFMPMSYAPKDGTVIIVVNIDAGGVEAVRFAEGLDGVFRWYNMEDEAETDEDETTFWLGWFFPPEIIRWPEQGERLELRQKAKANAPKRSELDTRRRYLASLDKQGQEAADLMKEGAKDE
jgi:hypothetical protein